MKKRFIVALDSTTPEQNSAFRDFVRETSVGWWHWLDNLWLLVDVYGTMDGQQLRDKANEIYPGIHKLVIELSPNEDTWYGFGPSGEVRNMFTWLKSNWKK